MKTSITDMLINYLLKGGILVDTKGDFETDIDIPVTSETGENRAISIRIKCKDLQIKTVKGDNNGV